MSLSEPMEVNECSSTCETVVDPVMFAGRKKITSLNDDCLESLFINLEWMELLSVADSSRHFYAAACLEFKRKYSNAKVSIGGFGSMPIASKHSTLVPLRNTNTISILNPVTALRFLRNFGHLCIWNLQVNCRLVGPELCEEIERYINKYCSKSLNTLWLGCSSSKSFFDGCVNAFERIDTLHVESCNFNCDLSILKLFPSLRVLNLGGNRYKNPNAIRVHLESVTDLTIQANKFEEIDIKEMLKLNSQLVRLEIFPVYSREIIQCIDEYLPNLRCLELRALSQEFYNEDPLLEPIRLEHIDHLSLHIGLPALRSIPFSFGNLKNLFINGSLELNQNCLQFFGTTNDLKLLTVLQWTDEGNNIRRFFELQNIWSNIEELHLSWFNHITTDCVLQFLQRSQSLKKITLNGSKFNEGIGDLKIGLTDSGWHMGDGLHKRQFIIERDTDRNIV